MSKELDAVIAKLNKKEEVIVRGKDLVNHTWGRATTGSLGIDLALGGGFPLDCVNEILGQPSAGKTTLAVQTVIAMQKKYPEWHCTWVAAEELDFGWAQQQGMDLDRVDFVMTNQMEVVYEICREIAKMKVTDCIVIDSLPHLVAQDEWDKDVMDITVGRSAYFTNKFMRLLGPAMKRSLVEEDRHMLILLINQWREKITQYGDPKTSPGGKGKDYAAVTRTEVTRINWLKAGDKKVGQTNMYKIIKNKSAPPMREATVDYYFEDTKNNSAGEYDVRREVWSIATDYDVLERKGAWYHFEGQKWNGKDAVWDSMVEDPDLVKAIDSAVRQFVLHQEKPDAVEEEPVKKRATKKAAAK